MRLISVLVAAVLLLSGVNMRFSEILVKMSRGQTLTAQEREQLRLDAMRLEQGESLVTRHVQPGTSTLVMDTVVAGGGEVVLDKDGVKFVVGSTDTDQANAVKWFLNVEEIFRMIGYTTGVNNQLLLQTNEIPDRNGQIVLRAHSPTSGSLSSVIRLGVFKDGVETGYILLSANSSGNDVITLNADQVIISNTHTPASASAAGTTGQIAWDANYIYICVATNTWKRVAISTW